jgi:YfiH family protein
VSSLRDVAVPAPFLELNGHYAIDLPDARAVFSTRRGGCSDGPYASLNVGFATDDAPEAQERNRETLRAQVGAPPGAWMYQTHSATVTILRDLAQAAERPQGDGRATRLPGVALGALGADCLTVAVAGGGAVAMVHAGWRGLAGGVLERGVERVRSLASPGALLVAAIGPGAGPCCYEVGPEVHAAFAGVPGARRGDNLDLVAVARARLAVVGVTEAHAVGLCTICEPALYFSHRRDRGVTGRQAGLVWVT